MTKISAIQSFTQASNAYRKALESSKNASKIAGSDSKDQIVSSAKQFSGVLRSGDVIDANGAKDGTAISFSEVIQGITKQKFEQVKKADRKIQSVIDDNDQSETNLVDVMSAVNESEVALQQIITIRDKFINAYQDIIKMPL